MKINKNIFICSVLIVLVLLCITAVSAEDNTDINSSNDNTVESDLKSNEITSGKLESNNYINKDNFFDYFDKNGCLYDNISYSSLTFADTFENMNISKITVKTPVTFTGYSNTAKFNNIAFDIISDKVSISNLSLNYNGEGALINVYGNNVKLDNLTINYQTKSDANAFAVYASDSRDFKLTDSSVNFKSNSIGTKGYYQHAIEIRDCENAEITKNILNCELPACDVIFDGEAEGINHDLVLVIGIQNGDNLTVSDNVIKTMVTGGYGELPTLDCLMADGFKNLKLINNIITQSDVSNEGNIGYSYAVDLYNFNGADIVLNDILVNSTAGADGYGSAYPIQLSGPYTDLVIEKNTLTGIGKGPALGIFSQNSAGPTKLTVKDNLINVTGYASKTNLYSLVSGMELQDSLARVYNNTIYAQSIDEYDDDNHLYGISYAQWFTNGHIYDIQNNTVITGGKYAVYLSNAVYSNVTGNDLRACKLFGDSSVSINSGENNTVLENIPPYTAEFIIDNSNAWVGFDKTVTVTIPHATTGNVVIIVNGKDYRGLKLANYTVSVNVDSQYIVTDSVNNITVIYSGDEIVLSGEEKATFKVLDGKITNMTFSNYFDANGNLYDFAPEGATLDFEGLFTGNAYSVFIDKNVNVITSTEAVFNGGDDLIKFTIGKGGDYTNISCIRFQNALLSLEGASHVTVDNVNITSKQSGVYIDSDSSYNTVKNCIIKSSAAYAIDLTDSKNNNVISNYLVSQELYGDDAVRSSASNLISDNVPNDPGLKVTAADILAGEVATIDISLKSDINGVVSVIVWGDAYDVNVVNGKGLLNVSDLPCGKHRIGVTYLGDLKYMKSTEYATFEVKKVVPVIDIDIDDVKLGSDVIVNVSISNATGHVSIVVNDVSNVVDLSDGEASYTIKSPKAGDYNVFVVYEGDEKYDGNYAAASFKLENLKTQFTNITIEDDMITAHLTGENGAIIEGADVEYTINGVEFKTKTSKDGSVSINGVSDSTIVVKFQGTDFILPCNLTINLKIAPSLRTSTGLFADDLKQYTCDNAAGEKGKYFKLQLKDIIGNPLVNKTVAVAFNGVVEYYQTDSNGWIEKQITLQSAGAYTVTSVFLGDDDYASSLTVNRITIIKKPTSITAKAKTYKVSLSKKSYSVTLKTVSSADGKMYLSAAKKITFTVNGKTYSAKTDSKGKATVNLKLTKKGKYTVKVSFAGDGVYSASSASAKITIK